jgi:nitrite reductase/ring-hydroxylating ferredoxin subunit
MFREEAEMNWLKILMSDALADEACQVVKLAEREVLLVKHGGEVFAVQSACPHMGGHLKDGKITADGHIICPLHHSEFDLRTGEIIAWAPWPPGVGAVLGAIRERRQLAVFPTKVEDGAIWVGMA